MLLPAGWQAWSDEKLCAVITHELNHVVRHDFFVAVATEFNRCLYWFHPAAWWLRRQLADLAEEACDDAAIEQTGDPTGYARHLLDLASLISAGSGRRVHPGLSMARQSNVEARVTTILDLTRPLSKRMTWPTATGILLVSALSIAAAAALGTVRATEPDESVSANAAAEQPPASDADTVRVHGRVTTVEGQPIAEARVRLYRSQRSDWYAASATATLVAETNVDSDGRFDRDIDRSLLPKKQGNERGVLVISAPGFAYSTFQADPATAVIDGKPVHKPDFMKQAIEASLLPQVPIR